jgi:hypothetical protein
MKKKCYICKELKCRTEFYFDNKEKTKLQSKCKKCHNKLKKERILNNPILKIIGNQKRRVRIICNQKNFKRTKKFNEIFGANTYEFKVYLENLFYNDITWENYSEKKWEVDHIKSLNDVETFEELIGLCHYTNLQPLLIEDHKKKTKELNSIKKS